MGFFRVSEPKYLFIPIFGTKSSESRKWVPKVGKKCSAGAENRNKKNAGTENRNKNYLGSETWNKGFRKQETVINNNI